MTVVTLEVSGMRTITLGLFGRSLESTTVSSAPSHNSPSPLTIRVNQALDDSFAQVIQNIPSANLEYKNCGGVSPWGFASTAIYSLAWIMSTWVWYSMTSGWHLWIITILIPTTASLYNPVCTWAFLGFLFAVFPSKGGVLESEWDLFTPPLHPAPSLLWVQGGFPRGFFSVQVPSLIFLSQVSLFRCAPESLLVSSPIVEMPAANLSLSEEAMEGITSTTSKWCSCCDKSAVVAAACLVLSFLCVSNFGPMSTGEIGSTLVEPPIPVQG